MKEFRIFVNKDISISDNDIHASFDPGGWACVIYIFFLVFNAFFIAAPLILLFEIDTESNLYTLFIFCGLFPFVEYRLVGYLIKKIKCKRQRKNMLLYKTKQAEEEAKVETSKVLRIYSHSIELFDALPKSLEGCSDWLDRAEYEFENNAFGPFWDAVEEAADYLASFNSSVRYILQNAENYYSSLKGRNHNFPSFSVRPESLPISSSIIKEFDRVVRMGQTNFQFATIWEQRKTREVLIAGFRTLGEAVGNLGVTIENSISDLSLSFSSEITRLVEEEIRTRHIIDEQGRKQLQTLEHIRSQHEKVRK